MFGSISDDAIAAAKGRSYQDVTSLKDPMAGIGGEVFAPFEGPAADALTLDYPGQPREEDGKFTFGKLGKGSKSSLKKRPKGAKMSKKEAHRVSSGILTDHPTWKPGELHSYFFDSYYYTFTVKGPGEYKFSRRLKIM